MAGLCVIGGQYQNSSGMAVDCSFRATALCPRKLESHRRDVTRASRPWEQRRDTENIPVLYHLSRAGFQTPTLLSVGGCCPGIGGRPTSASTFSAVLTCICTPHTSSLWSLDLPKCLQLRKGKALSTVYHTCTLVFWSWLLFVCCLDSAHTLS